MTKIVLSPSGKEIECGPSETVLSALEKNGYALPNNCRAGACGECKVKVKSGNYDQGFILDMALTNQEREEGYGLMCMAKPTSDVLEIEWAAEEGRPKLFAPKENVAYMVVEKNLVTPSIAKLKLRSLGEPMRFWPGQYVTFGSRRGPARCYSIGNIPNSQGELEFYITKIEDGKTSAWVHDSLENGDVVYVNGPYGTFIGDPSAQTPVLCLAAGSGLAPILSLASGALMRGGFKHPATILFSAKTKKDLLEFGHLSYLKNKFRNFDFKYTLTQEENPQGLSGRIQTLLPAQYPDLSAHSIYIAGSPEFVASCKAKVLELGAKEDLVYTEGFTPQ
jgi:CDP-4-dehydro-6-deoxyglucose reductase